MSNKNTFNEIIKKFNELGDDINKYADNNKNTSNDANCDAERMPESTAEKPKAAECEMCAVPMIVHMPGNDNLSKALDIMQIQAQCLLMAMNYLTDYIDLLDDLSEDDEDDYEGECDSGCADDNLSE